MIWWIKAWGALGAATATAVALFVAVTIGTREIPVPALTGQAGQFVVAELVALLPAVLILHGVHRGDPRTEYTAVRSGAVRMVAWVAVWVTMVWGATAAAHLLGADSAVIEMARNTTGYVGVALLLRPVAGLRAAVAFSAAVPLVCAAAGWRTGGVAQPWAWPLHPANSVLALLQAFLLLGLGLIAVLLRPRETPG
ncbi:hypothetical protein GL263_13830 [Streptomyces durbertensis]|uniref:ABC transporter permease n=1 Tax=Streptomyces durbertensis TaxID=2448886 RepID=A0ABR6EH27_9ACTN|nr:hypothetical protein [Streptomyces durbertensis]MBB1244636.1 hypothetical protein [Streptomyces durbertensis]